MFSRRGRALAIVAALLVAPLLASALAVAVPLHDHGCSFDKDCLTCRWAASAVAEVLSPAAAPGALEAAGAAPAAPTTRARASERRAAATRGPPPTA